MSAPRSRKEEKIYKTYRSKKNAKCEFCNIEITDGRLITATDSFRVVRNIFAYSIWDGQDVVDHLMIVPKKHIEDLGSLTPSQASEYLKLVSKYEKKGYNVYARAPSSVIKSVVHQHTHLIKTQGAPKNLIFLLRKPFYFRIVG